MNTNHIVVIYSFLSGLKENDTVKIQNLIDAMEDHIIKSFFDADRKIDYKAVWLKRIQTCTSNRNLRLVCARAWKTRLFLFYFWNRFVLYWHCL